MSLQSLIAYIKDSRAHSKSDEEIKNDLLKVGWQEQQINEAFESLNAPDKSAFPPPPTVNEEPSPKESSEFKPMSAGMAQEPTPQTDRSPITFENEAPAEDPTNAPKGSTPQNSTNQISQSPSEDYGGKLLGPIELIKKSISLYKPVFWKIILTFNMPILFMIPFGILVGIYAATGFTSSFIWIPIVLVFLAATVLIIWSQLTGLVLISRAREKPTLKESFGIARKLIFRYLGLMFLVGGISIILALLLVIPAYAFMIPSMLTMYILIEEDIGGITNILKAKAYVKGYWWKIFGRLLSMMGIFFLIMTPLMVIQMLSDRQGGIFFATLSFIISLLYIPIYPIFAFYINLIYKNIRAINPLLNWQPKKSKKTLYTIMGVLGLLAIPAFMVLMLFAINPQEIINQSQSYQEKMAADISERQQEAAQPQGDGMEGASWVYTTDEQTCEVAWKDPVLGEVGDVEPLFFATPESLENEGFEAIGRRQLNGEGMIAFDVITNMLPEEQAPYYLFALATSSDGQVCAYSKLGKFKQMPEESVWITGPYYLPQENMNDLQVFAITRNGLGENDTDQLLSLDDPSIILYGSFAQSQQFTDSLNSTSPNTATPTPTPSSVSTTNTSSGFSSTGAQSLGNNVTLQITTVTQNNDSYTATLVYKNSGSSSQNVQPLQVSMNSATYGTAGSPSYMDMPVGAGQSKTLTLTYEKLSEDPPYTWKSLTIDGSSSVTLGTYK